MPKPIDPDTQHALFLEAIELLGGQRETARRLPCSERTLRNLVSRTHPIHDGFLRDMAAALVDRADACRALEKRLNPMFSANVTAEQPREDGRRFARADGKPWDDRAGAVNPVTDQEFSRILSFARKAR